MLACELSESKVCARLMVRGIASMAIAVSCRCASRSSSAALRAGCRYEIRLRQHAPPTSMVPAFSALRTDRRADEKIGKMSRRADQAKGKIGHFAKHWRPAQQRRPVCAEFWVRRRAIGFQRDSPWLPL